MQEPGILININYPIPTNYTQPGPVSSINHLREQTENFFQAVWTGN